MERRIPRLLFAAPRSGSGKTLITCGFLEVLKKRGIRPVSFKCGPDYIDPMFHNYVLGIPGGNLDSFFLKPAQVREELWQMTELSQGELTVIEGVMGYYDGLGGISTEASSYDIAKICNVPVVLILDCKGASVSLAALVKGFQEYRKDSNIKGVILNRIPKLLYQRLVPVIEEGETPIPVFGYLPENEAFNLKSRHLGLFMPDEVEKLREIIAMLAEQIEQTIDVDGLIRLAGEAKPLAAEGIIEKEEKTEKAEAGSSVRIGVARDEAFCFYYQENLKLMEQMGAELIFFSPLHDERLPGSLDGLLFGGGYPENHGRELSKNYLMLESIREASYGGMPILAECGGFLYLHRSLESSDGAIYGMVGIVDAAAYRTDRLQRFGYVTLTMADGRSIKGHEFHYWESSAPGDCWKAEKPMSDRSWSCVHERDGLIAGFPHLYYPSNPEFIREWLNRCRTK